MGASQNLSSLNCELRIIRAKNLEPISTGNIFVRYYICTGNNKRIRLNTHQTPITTDPYWNESISLECSGTQDSMEELKQQTVILELRWRCTTPVIGKICRSKLLGKAEISWKDVLESSELAIEKWIRTVSTTTCGVLHGFKPPSLQIGMKIQVPRKAEMTRRGRDSRLTKWNECGCRNGECNRGHDDDIFALAAAFEAF